MQEYFTCEPGKEAEAARVQDKSCKSRLSDLYHEARIQCLINWHADMKKQRMDKKAARAAMLKRETDLTKDDYVLVSRVQFIKNGQGSLHKEQSY